MNDRVEVFVEGAEEPWAPYARVSAAELRTHSSTLIAKTLEYKLLGDICTELLLRGQTFDVLRGDVDAFGHDLVIEACGIVRHIQLKTKVMGGKNSEVTCHTELGLKPSGCIIWATYDPETYTAVEYHCFGGLPGDILPDVGNLVAKRSTHNGNGDRPLRIRHRTVRRARFEKITQIADLVDWLFVRKTAPDQVQAPKIVTGPGGNAMLISTGKVTVLPVTTNLTNQIAVVSVVRGPGTLHDLISIGGSEQHGTWCFIDLKTGTWEIPSDLPDDDGAIAHALAVATAKLQAQLANSATESAQ